MSSAQSSAPFRWLVIGAAGMLGSRLVADLNAAGADVTGLSRADVDVTDAAAVLEMIRSAGADIVVNATAYTAVDDAETHEAQALAVNGDGPANLAVACAATGSVLLHVSTDYVFPGDATTPYAEDARTGPATAYGRTKLVGEQRVHELLPDRSAIVRTAWLYGPGGANFVSTMLRLERQRDHVDVVDDQYGQPTSTAVVSRALRDLGPLVAAGAAAGVFHATCSGATTWFGLARKAFELAGADPDRVRPTDSSTFKRPAPRPSYSVLSHARWAEVGLRAPLDWEQALEEAFPALTA
ncbi:MAG TPA: dTDP-4-dehydrorhamnose reductase [Actinopolymorphaceae bacterium]|jgi:dTDP-4-dehydrorhamnose reductase